MEHNAHAKASVNSSVPSTAITGTSNFAIDWFQYPVRCFSSWWRVLVELPSRTTTINPIDSKNQS